MEPHLQKVSKRNFENRLLKSAASRIIKVKRKSNLNLQGIPKQVARKSF